MCRLTNEEWDEINRGLHLTSRELDVVRGIVVGETEAGIAIRLRISPNTVHTHLGRVYRKLGVHSAATLILRIFSTYVIAQRAHNTPTASRKSPDPIAH